MLRPMLKRLRTIARGPERPLKVSHAAPAPGQPNATWAPKGYSDPELRLTIVRKLLGTLKPGRLLDLGCGHGKFSLLAQELGWDVTAVDARTVRMPGTAGIQWVHSDVREFVIEPGRYDLILVLGLLYHLELGDQLDLLRKCSGTPTVVDTHAALAATHQEGGYDGRSFREIAADDAQALEATPTASWGNPTSFWATEDSLVRMITDCGFSFVYRLTPGHERDRTFYFCL